ncbi:MAG: DUF485 domain-containing protein [Rubrivivax sp.]|jgi:uncharacterized membrane protein (DUF485 family)|nr:DUF485 domain-containing protein [Rubrivivax sp.]
MDVDLTQRIASHPKYRELKAKRTSFGWTLTIAMLAVYYGFILVVAFNKELLATRMGEGVMTYGMPIGVGVILFTVLITVFYVRRANREFDALTDEVNKAVLR